MARERMAMSYPTPPPSHSDNQSDISDLSHEKEEHTVTVENPELVAIASKLVGQVLAKVVADQCMMFEVPLDEYATKKDEVRHI